MTAQIFETKAAAFDYLTRGRGFRYERVRAALGALALPVTLHMGQGGYVLASASNGWEFAVYSTLTQLAAGILQELAAMPATATAAPAAPVHFGVSAAGYAPQTLATCLAPAGPSLPPVRKWQAQQQQQPQQGPAMQTGPRTRSTGPLGLPADAAALLKRFGLTLDSILTGAENAKMAKGEALSVILHHLPARSLAAAVSGPDDASTAPRSRLPGLAELARLNNLESLIASHNGCPWASKGCAGGCLNWSGHGGISTNVASCRARRTMALIYDARLYAICVLWAIGREYKRAQAKRVTLAVRLRGTDDTGWHALKFNLSPDEAVVFARRFGLPIVPGVGTTIAECLQLAEPGTIELYEYSKAPLRGPLGLLAQRAAGIDTTASLAADRQGGLRAAMEAVDHGFRVAIPVAYKKGAPVPCAILLRQDGKTQRLIAVDGDLSDNRWLDPQGPAGGWDGVAVMLRTKVSQGADRKVAATFSLTPTAGWQPLAGCGEACLIWPA